MSTRDRILWVAFLLLAAGAAFFWTQPYRRMAALQTASLPQLRQWSQERPGDVEVWRRLAAKQRADGDLKAAYDSYAQTAQLAPRDWDAWNAAAELAYTLHGRQGAFDLLGVYTANNPQDGRGHLALSRLYFLNQSHERAISSAKAALASDPKLAEAWRILGWEALTNGAQAEAESLMRKGIDVDPKDFHNQVGMGDVLATGERFTDALPFYRRALALAPDESNVQIMTARALLRSSPGDLKILQEAEPLVRKSLAQDDGRAITHVVLADILERQGNLAAAAQEYETAALLDPKYPDTFFRLAQLYRKQKDNSRFAQWSARHRTLMTFIPAEKVLRQRRQKASDPVQVRAISLELARQTADAGLLQDAEEQVTTLLKEKRDAQAEALQRRIAASRELRLQTLIKTPTQQLVAQGDRLLGRGQISEALPLYFLAVRRNRYHAVALQNVGLCLNAQNRPEEALLFLTDALRNDPGLSRARFALGDIAAQYQMLDEAQAHYEKGLQRESGNAEAQFRLGEIYRNNQEQSKSYAAFERAYTLKPGDPRYAREWADSLEEQGKENAAEAVLRKSLAAVPDDGENKIRLGTLLLRKPDKIAEADLLLTGALSADPSNDLARYGLAQVRVAQGRFAQARPMLEDLTRRNPAAREIWVSLGQTARRMGDTKAATQALDRARVLEQKFLAGRTLAGQVAQRPNDDALRIQLARAQADAGETLKALTNYEYVLRRQTGRADWKQERDRLRKTLGATGAPDATLAGILHESLSKSPPTATR